MIKRVWRGWTTRENGPAYEQLLRQQVFPGIAAKGVHGYREIQLLRRDLPSGEVEYMTIMSFDSLDAVRAFAGDDYQRAHVPQAARQVLSRFDESSAHYEVLEELAYQGSR
jgi:heme-degrading monooxygenase HmoA